MRPTMPGALLVATGALSLPCAAQEAMYTQAATMPGPGTAILREQFQVFRYGSNPVSGTENTTLYQLETGIQAGLAPEVSLMLRAPLAHTIDVEPGGDESSHTAIDDAEALLKWRFYRNDTGGVDTVRIAALVGAAFDTDDHLTANPEIGAVFTAVRGRHGFDQDLIYTLTTDGSDIGNLGGEGQDDALAFNTAYLYRVHPARYTSESRGAWYTTVELNGLYELNGDVELRWSPGLMYEGRYFGFELMGQLPLWNDLDHRAELDWAVGFGIRVLF